MAKKTVVVKVTSKGLKQTTADAKELEKVLKKIGKQKTNAGGKGGAPGSDSGAADKTKRQTDQTKKNTKANHENADSGNRVYNSNRGISGSSGKAGKDMGNMAAGMGGFIHVYATLAAHAFALSAAFNILKGAMDTSIMVKGLEEMGAASGTNLKMMARDFRNLTGDAVTTAQAMSTVAFASSAGMDGQRIGELAKVARGAALALGRDVGDAVDRLTRGVVKLEPEILDELGLIVRVDQASEKYAKTIGKKVTELTAYEKQQAFANETIEQGIRKYGALNDKLESNPYDSVASGIADLVQDILNMTNTIIGPVLKFIAGSKLAIMGLLIGMSTFIVKKIVPSLAEFNTAMGKRMIDAADAAAASNRKYTATLVTSTAATAADTKAQQERVLALANANLEKHKVGFKPGAKSLDDPLILEKSLKTRLTKLKHAGQQETAIYQTTNSEYQAIQQANQQAATATDEHKTAIDNHSHAQSTKTAEEEIARIKADWAKKKKMAKKGAKDLYRGMVPRAGQDAFAVIGGSAKKAFNKVTNAGAKMKKGLSGTFTATKVLGLQAFTAIGNAAAKMLGPISMVMMAASLLMDPIIWLLEKVGILSEGSDDVNAAFSDMDSHLEALKNTTAEYQYNLASGDISSALFIKRHEMMGNSLKEFENHTKVAAKAVGKYEEGVIGSLDTEVESLRDVIKEYSNFGNVKLNKGLQDQLDASGVSLDNMVDKLEDEPQQLKNLLSSLGPILEDAAREAKNTQSALEELQSSAAAYSDAWKDFGDTFKSSTPFDKLVEANAALLTSLAKSSDALGSMQILLEMKPADKMALGIMGVAASYDELTKSTSKAKNFTKDAADILKGLGDEGDGFWSLEWVDRYWDDIAIADENGKKKFIDRATLEDLVKARSKVSKAAEVSLSTKAETSQQKALGVMLELNTKLLGIQERSIQQKQDMAKVEKDINDLKGIKGSILAIDFRIAKEHELHIIKRAGLTDQIDLQKMVLKNAKVAAADMVKITKDRIAKENKALEKLGGMEATANQTKIESSVGGGGDPKAAEAVYKAEMARIALERVAAKNRIKKQEVLLSTTNRATKAQEEKLQAMQREVSLADDLNSRQSRILKEWQEALPIISKEYEVINKLRSNSLGMEASLVALMDSRTAGQKLAKTQAQGQVDQAKLLLGQESERFKLAESVAYRQQQIKKLSADADTLGTRASADKLAAAKSVLKAESAQLSLIDRKHEAEKEILSLKQKQAMIDASGAKDVFSRVAAFKKEISGDALSDDLLSIGAGSIYADQEASTKNIKDYQVIVLDRLKEQSNEYEKHLGFIKAQIAVVNDPRETVVDRKDATFADQGTALYDEMQKGTGKFADTSTSTSTSTSTTSETALAEVSGDTAAAAALAAENRRDAETELNKWLIDENQSTLDVMALHWEKYSEKAGLSQIKGFGRMATAFNGYSKLSGKQQERKNRLMDTLDKKQFKSETDRAAAKVKLSGKLVNIETQEKLSANAGMFGAMGDMMAKNSKAQQAFHAIEKAMHLAKMAMMAVDMATTMGLLPVKAAEAAADGAAKDPNPYTKIATGLAIFAAISALIGGAGGASSTATPKTQRVQGSASLETPEEKSDSLKTALDNIEEIEIKAFEQGWDVLYALRSIDDSMTKLSTDIIKGMQALGGVGTFSIGDMETVFGDWFGTSVKPAFLGLFGGKSTTTELMGAGIQIVAQKLADVIDLDAGKWANLELKVWEKIKTTTTKSGFMGFGGGTSSSSQTKWKDFDTEAEQSFAKTLFDIGDAVLNLGEDLGYARSDLIDNLKDFEIAVQDIDLMGLSPEEQASAVQSALSSIANDITLKMLPAVEQWRHAGEEYLEALSRVYRDMLGFKQAFATIGLSTKDFLSATGVTDILNWQQKVLSSSKGGFVDIKGLLSTMEKFSKALYSEGELAKIALDNAKDRVGTGLAEFGLAAGTSADEFRAWYESKLGTGFFDDPDKLATMLRLGEAFGDMTNSADDLSSAFGDIIGLIDDMKYGELSSLTDADKYSYYKTEAERLSTAAMGGDIAAGEQLADMMSKFTEMSKDMFGGVGTFMTDRDWALKQLEDFRALMGFATGGIAAGGFKAFANGGLVNRPTLGLVGEGAFNEAIVPLPDGKSIPVSMNSNPMVMEIRAFREEQAQLMQSAVTISTQERDEMKDAMEGMKQEIIELRSSTEGFGSSVERVATSIDYGRA